jgi:predicted ester cyclase
MGIPGTGKQVEVTGTATSHFKNGKIVEHLADWDAVDAVRMMQQLGVVKS